MIQKYTYGTPFETDAIVTSIPTSEGTPAYGTISTENGFSFIFCMVWLLGKVAFINVSTFVDSAV